MLAEQSVVNSNWTTESMCLTENGFEASAKVILILLEKKDNNDERERMLMICDGFARAAAELFS